uniref:Uncharacterized protein n=1 Tax=Cryptomonas curvata TaxID=233186 RepID=A0A7S0MU87_9CRYP
MHMSYSRMLLPVSAMVGLTGTVWFKLFVDRIGELNRRKITPEKLKSGEQKFEDVQSSDHFKNLFEVPVLFYTLCGALALTKADSDLQYYAAWTFVGLRVGHAYIHCTYNNIMQRLYVYLSSTLLLFGMWAVFVAQIATGRL